MKRKISAMFRHLLLAMLLAGTAASSASLAAAPAKQMTQVPGYYRMMLGEFEITALYDGYVSLDATLLKGINEKDLQSLLARMFVPASANGVQTAVNAFLVNTGDKLMLVDAGAAKCFGPTLGAITANIAAAGYDAAQVDAVLLTHLHGDHACGIVTADGKAAFPNAEVFVARNEAAFWLDEKKAAEAPKELQPFFRIARDAVAPYLAAGKLKQFTAGDTLVKGVVSVPLHGHTPGHGGYLFSSGGQQLLAWGDVVHSHAVQFLRPDISLEFDVDQKQAVSTRKRVLSDAATKKLWIAGAHLPFPGIGHVRKEKNGYAWVPMEYAPLPEQR